MCCILGLSEQEEKEIKREKVGFLHLTLCVCDFVRTPAVCVRPEYQDCQGRKEKKVPLELQVSQEWMEKR